MGTRLLFYRCLVKKIYFVRTKKAHSPPLRCTNITCANKISIFVGIDVKRRHTNKQKRADMESAPTVYIKYSENDIVYGRGWRTREPPKLALLVSGNPYPRHPAKNDIVSANKISIFVGEHSICSREKRYHWCENKKVNCLSFSRLS